MQHYFLTVLLLITFLTTNHTQTSPFQIAIDPMNIDGLGGVHSFALGQYDGKWLIIGGRLDGLHRRQPWAAFDEAGNNDQLIVVDPVNQQHWSASIESLPFSIQEQLSSTNPQFSQEGEYLYIIGGYGYSPTAADHITHSKLTAVKVDAVIDAVINGQPFAAYFRQITDEKFEVTGGYLNKIYDTYYLTGGQKFTGRYNPMNGPSFVQEYTNAIRKFTIQDDGVNLAVTHLTEILDTDNLHRRDYNVAEQIMPNGEQGLTAFSGVFQKDIDLPFLNCVNIDSTGYAVNNDFAQYYNHYHCAHISIYSAEDNEMHTVFFGGIAQYYEANGELIQDDDVPFVKTIARVTRDAEGVMAEYKLPVEMPGLLGAGSEFIPVEGLPQYNNGVLSLDDFPMDTVLVGYIYGGISSTEANIFFINDGSQSSANSQIFKVFLIKDGSVGTDELNEQSTGSLQLQLFPNPTKDTIILKFKLKKSTDVKLNIFDLNGRLIEQTVIENAPQGLNTYAQDITSLGSQLNGVYYLSIETEDTKAVQKLIIE